MMATAKAVKAKTGLKVSVPVEIIVLLVLLAISIGVPVGAFYYEDTVRPAQMPTVDMVVHRVEDGGFKPNEIRMKKGETVRIIARSEDVVHTLVAPDLGLFIPEIYPGKTTILEFTPEQTGTFPFMCATWCSPMHPGMTGTIVVE